MKKLLLSILLAMPFLANAQVTNPEVVRTPLAKTGWSATASSFFPNDGTTTNGSVVTTNGPAATLIDGYNNTWWSWNYSSNGNPITDKSFPYILTINMGASQSIDGIYIRNRNSGNCYSAKDVTVETSADGQTWQNSMAIVVQNNNSIDQFFSFPSAITCQQYRLTITSNYRTDALIGGDMSETGAFKNSIPDNTAYSRTAWTASTTNFYSATQNASATIDVDVTSFWSVNWSTTQPFPHEIIYTMDNSQPINKISYVQRVYAADARSVVKGNLIFSNDANFATGNTIIPFVWTKTSTGSPQLSFPLGQTITAKYIKLSVTGNADNATLPDGALGSTCLAEFRAHYDATLPVTITEFTAKANGSQVNLAWSTSSEQNSASFDVLRGADATNFTKIGSVQAAGNSNSTKAYHFTDFSPLKGDNYYKLTQTDKDGTVNTDAKWVASAKIAGADLSLTVSTSSSTLEANIYSPKAGKGTLSVTNVTGQKLGSTTVQLTEGYNKVSVPVNAGAGVVIATLTTAKGTLSKKAIK